MEKESLQISNEERALLKSEMEKIDGWDFNKNSPDLTRKFLSDLITEVREKVYVPNSIDDVQIPDKLLPEEIKNELEEPYGPRIYVLLGKGSQATLHEEDRDKLAVIVLGEGYFEIEGMGSPTRQNWSLYFILRENAVTVRDEGAGGPNCVNVVGFTDKYSGDQKTLLKVVGKLTKASLIQHSSLKTS